MPVEALCGVDEEGDVQPAGLSRPEAVIIVIAQRFLEFRGERELCVPGQEVGFVDSAQLS